MTARFNAGLAAVALPIIVSFGSVLCGSAKADPLDSNQVPVSNAIAKLDKAYGISIVISGSISPRTPVSLSVEDTSGSSYPVFAVNTLANSLGLDYQKTFIISKVADASGQPAPRLDTNSDVNFADDKVDAAIAIEKVAMFDGATVQFTDTVSGQVTLTDNELKAQDAATQLAQLTHTHWEAVYTLYSRSDSPTKYGKVVDRTNEGQPIVQLPFATNVYTPRPQPTRQVTASTNTTLPMTTVPVSAPGTTVTQPAQAAAVVPTAPVNPYGLQYPAQYGLAPVNPYGYLQPAQTGTAPVNQYGYQQPAQYGSAPATPYGYQPQPQYGTGTANPYGYQSYDPNSAPYFNQYTDPNYTPYYNSLDGTPLGNSNLPFTQPYVGGPMIYGNGSVIVPSNTPYGVTVLP